VKILISQPMANGEKLANGQYSANVNESWLKAQYQRGYLISMQLL